MQTIKNVFSIFVVMLLLLNSAVALADKILKSQHNGQTKVAGSYYLELVANESELLLYVTDHDWRPSDTEGLVFQAYIVVAGKKIMINFAREQGHKFVARGVFGTDETLMVIIKFQRSNKSSKYIRFKPYQKINDEHQH